MVLGVANGGLGLRYAQASTGWKVTYAAIAGSCYALWLVTCMASQARVATSRNFVEPFTRSRNLDEEFREVENQNERRRILSLRSE